MKFFFANLKLIVSVVAVILLLWIGGCVVRNAQPAFTKWQLKRTITHITPWPAMATDYKADDWQKLVKAARALQQADSALATLVISERLDKASDTAGELADDQTRIFLLLRTAFNLPQQSPQPGQFGFEQWPRNNTDLNSNGTANMAWPILWNDGKPQLAAGRPAPLSGSYEAKNEFTVLRFKFAPRDLKTFQP